jgi:hypothetical protein
VPVPDVPLPATPVSKADVSTPPASGGVDLLIARGVLG